MFHQNPTEGAATEGSATEGQDVAIESQRGKTRISWVIQKNIGRSSFSAQLYGFGQLAPSGTSAFIGPTNETSIT